MKKALTIAAGALALTAALMSAPAAARWNLVERAAPVSVVKGAMIVTPQRDWNRSTSRPMKKGEVWTLDGVSLNSLYFVAGLSAGETMFKDTDKKNRPLPKLGTAMQVTDIPDFVEGSLRIAMNTSLFELTSVEPATLAGHSGVRFSFDYAAEGSPLRYKGVAIGAMVGDALYLTMFTAPSNYYFDRDSGEAEAIMASARL